MVPKNLSFEQNDLVELREINFDMFFMNFDGVRICSWMFLNFEEKMKKWFDGRKNESPRKLKFLNVTKSRFIKIIRVQVNWVHKIFKFLFKFLPIRFCFCQVHVIWIIFIRFSTWKGVTVLHRKREHFCYTLLKKVTKIELLANNFNRG